MLQDAGSTRRAMRTGSGHLHRAALALLFVSAIAAGCERRCTRGVTQACICGSARGSQVCLDDESGWDRCSCDPDDAGLPDAGSLDGSLPPSDTAAPWEPSSRIGAAHCALDLDCDPGQHCALGLCTSECSDAESCPAGLFCSVRGRCEPTASSSEPEAPRALAGHLVVDTPTVRLGPGERYGVVQFRVTGLEAGASPRYWLDTSNGLVTLPEGVRSGPAALVTEDGTTESVVGIPFEMDSAPETLAETGGRSTIRIVSDAGTSVIRVLSDAALHGRYTGTINVDAPLALGAVPFAFELWPSPDGASDHVRVIVYPEDNLLFPRTEVADGRWDPASRTVSFAFDSVLARESLTNRSAAGVTAPPRLDLVSSTIAARLSWGQLRADDLNSPFGRVIARRVQVRLDFDPDSPGLVRGSYSERLEGLAPTTVEVRGSVVVQRGLSTEGILQSIAAAVADSSARGPDGWPTYPPPAPSSPIATVTYQPADRPDVTVACGALVARVPACAGITADSFSEQLIACADGAFDDAYGMADAFATTGGFTGAAYQQAYGQCIGLASTTSRELQPPDLESEGCLRVASLSCAFAAYGRAAQRTTLPRSLGAAYEGVFRVMQSAAEVYAFLANEYEIGATRVPLRATRSPSGGGIAEDLNIDDEVAQRRYAASSMYLALASLAQAALFEELWTAPTVIPGSASETERVERAHRRTLVLYSRVAAETLRLTTAAVAAGDRAEWSDRDRTNDEAGTYLRSVALVAYLEAAALGYIYRSRVEPGTPSTDPSIGNGALRDSFVELTRLQEARLSGMNPLGYDPSFVRLAARASDDTRQNFEILLARYTGTGPGTDNAVEAAATALEEFRLNQDSWLRAEADLRRDVDGVIDYAADRLRDICGSALVVPPHPAWGTDGPASRPPSEDDLADYDSRVDAYIRACADASSGTIRRAGLDMQSAALDSQRADREIQEVRDLIAIRQQRTERVHGINNTYLNYQLDGIGERTALQLAERDVSDRSIERERNIGILDAVTAGVNSFNVLNPVSWFGPAAIGGSLSAQLKADSAWQTNNAMRDIDRRRGEMEQRQAMRLNERDRMIADADLEAEVRSLLVRMPALRIQATQADLRFQQAALQYADLLAEAEAAVARRDADIVQFVSGGSSPLADPVFRTTATRTARVFQQEMRTARVQSFLLLRAVELDINDAVPLEREIFRAILPEELRLVNRRIGRVMTCFRESFVGSARDPRAPGEEISMRRHLFGIGGPTIDPVTRREISEGEQFRRRVFSVATLQMDGTTAYVEVPFNLDLTDAGEVDPMAQDSRYFVSSLNRCNEQITRVRARFVGDRLGGTTGEVRLRQEGSGLLRSCEGAASALPEINAFDMNMEAPSMATLQVSVNGGFGSDSSSLVFRPIGGSRWVLAIYPSSTPNRALDLFDALDDIVLQFDTEAYQVVSGRSFDALSCGS